MEHYQTLRSSDCFGDAPSHSIVLQGCACAVWDFIRGYDAVSCLRNLKPQLHAIPFVSHWKSYI